MCIGITSHNETTGSDSQFVGYAVNRKFATQSHKRKEPVCEKSKIVGLDVHAETITVVVAETDGEVRSLGVIANRAEVYEYYAALGREGMQGPVELTAPW